MLSTEEGLPEPSESQIRKATPVYRGFFRYFPKAIRAVTAVSQIGNNKHNPGEDLHWAKEKSTDEPDCVLRHMLDEAECEIEGEIGAGGVDESGVLNLASTAWRAMANLERLLDAHPELLRELLVLAARGGVK